MIDTKFLQNISVIDIEQSCLRSTIKNFGLFRKKTILTASFGNGKTKKAETIDHSLAVNDDSFETLLGQANDVFDETLQDNAFQTCVQIGQTA